MKKRIVVFFEDMLNFIGVICISVLVILNCTYLYSYCIRTYNISKQSSMSEDLLMKNYNNMVSYLRNPFKTELNFNEIGMSENGRIHFKEVKDIFMIITFISIIFIVKLFIDIIKKRKYIIGKMNRSANIILTIITFIGLVISISFSKVFYYFHKIFFNNDYWIFDRRTDPIIDALPEDVFRVLLIGIVVLLIIFIIIVKVLKYVSHNKT